MNRLTLVCAGAILAAGCGSTAPTPVPPTPDAPQIHCPTAQTIQLTGTATSAIVTYAPTTTNGTPPLTVVCTPPSGSSFPVGITGVTCRVIDAIQRSDSCSFGVTVLKPVPSPTLTVTRFVAFGDSITAGEDGTDGGPDTGGLCQPVVTSTAQRRTQVILPDAQTYPGQLEQMLTGRYPTQSPTMLNRGCPGEAVTLNGAVNPTTLKRFDAIMTMRQQDVVLIMEGSNDLDNTAQADPSTQNGVIGSTAAGLRQMVQDARTFGFRPFLATIPPMNPCTTCNRGGGAGLVTMLNDRIRQIGGAEQVPIVDVYAAFNGNLTLLGADGLHPNASGYQTIAQTFFTSIKSTLEVSTAAQSPLRRR